MALLFAVSIVLTIAVAVGWSYATGYKIIMDHSEADALNAGGMGLGLVRQIADAMRYERKDNQNILTLRFSL